MKSSVNNSSVCRPRFIRRQLGFLLLAMIAAVGLVASVACHILGWMLVEPPWGKSVFVLHIGVIVLLFPLVVYSNRTMPKPRRNNMEHLLAELPRWVRVVTGCLFAYALLNFGYFIFCTRHYPKHGVPFTLELRGFSGHWIMFYGVALAGFVALARLSKKRK